MNPEHLLTRLRTLGAGLCVEGDDLVCKLPPGQWTPELKESLVQNKQAIIALISGSGSRDSAVIPKMLTVTGAAAPLSFAQQRLWFIDRLKDGQSSAYNIPIAFRLRGDLNIVVLERSLSEILRRHEVLRTRFMTVKDEVAQIVVSPTAFPLSRIDLHSNSEPQHNDDRAFPDSQSRDVDGKNLEKLLARESTRPFNLITGPVIRGTLYHVSDSEHVLLLVIHHIVADDWSVGLLKRELSQLYDAFLHNEPSPLPDLPLQYRDYSLWQREWLHGERYGSELAYWMNKLDGEMSVLGLPMDRERPAVQTFRGATHQFQLSPHLTDSIRKLGRELGATLFMTLLAAFKTLLFRYSSQEDVLVGTAVANRSSEEIESLIGFFVNTLVLRTDLSGNPSFYEVLRRVRNTVLEGQEHQVMPFDRLVAELHPRRSANSSAFFQTFFILQNAPALSLAFTGLETSVIDVDSHASKFDLTLAFRESPDGLSGSLQYNTDLFDAATIERLAIHYRALLGSIVANPNTSIRNLQFLGEQEQRLILGEWNDTASKYQKDTCIHELFEDQVIRAPEAIALSFNDTDITYGELNKRAVQLAASLIESGARTRTAIGLCAHRSVEAIVGMLAILKTGCAYVALDPKYPEERIKYIVEDANLGLVVVQYETRGVFSSLRCRTIPVPSGVVNSVESDVFDLPRSAPDDLAYIMYTSGSTGNPKGVCVEHRNIVNLLSGSDYHQFSNDQVYFQFISIGFDLSVFEIWAPLLSGAKLVIAPPNRPTTSELGCWIRESGVTTLMLTAGWFRLLADSRIEDLRNVRHLFIGADVVPAKQTRFALSQLKNTRVVNAYGPTEVTVFALCHSMFSGDTFGDSVPIGRPISNTQVYILDDFQLPVAVGVAGELYIGGHGVARGYLHLTDLTRDRFLPDPFSMNEHGRMYRTGDWCRWLPDGRIEFLGRRDNQVKINGYRIELGEIESTISQCDGVRNAAVTVRTPDTGGKEIVAWIELSDSGQEMLRSIRRFVKSRLPAYMVPAHYVLMDSIPVTRNGKIDRASLQNNELPGPIIETEITEPETDLEEFVFSLWKDLFATNDFGVKDDFFDLGGHSLLALQMISRLEETLRIHVPVSSIFQYPTVRELAYHIRVLQAEGSDISHVYTSEDVASFINDRPSSRAFAPLSFAQQRLWFVDRLENGQSATYNVPSAMRLVGKLDTDALKRTLSEFIRRHDILRTHIRTLGDRTVQVTSTTFEFSLKCVDLRAYENSAPVDDLEERAPGDRKFDVDPLTSSSDGSSLERQLTHLLETEASKPFNLTTGPVIRGTLYQLHEEDFVLLIVIHHIATDGWSMGILRREISLIYNAFLEGNPSPLDELPIQYADYAAWQRDWLQGQRYEHELEYWRAQLENAPPILDLPTDHARPAIQTFRGASHRFALRPELTAKLIQLSRTHGVTLFTTLLSIFKTLLYRYTGQHDLLVGTVVANRAHEELESLIGFFVNTLVLRTDCSGSPTFTELLERVRAVVIGAQEHQVMPFERLVAELHPDRSASYSALFQVMCVLQTARDNPLEMKNIQAERILLDSNVAKNDLSLIFTENGSILEGSLYFNSDLFDIDTIERMADHFQVLTENVTADPKQSISTIPLLTEWERNQILVEWNSTAADYPEEACVHELFEERVRETPTAVAVEFRDHQLSYSELNNRANSLAYSLIEARVGPDTPVGICSIRSNEMVVGLLGILKSGNYYVPFDISLPSDRLEYMLHDSGVKFVLVHIDCLHAVPEGPWKVLLLSDEPVYPDVPSPTLRRSSRSPIYLIYTSGSTGKPKGVLVEHRGVVRLICNERMIKIKRDDIFLQHAPISFDASALEIWGPLVHGSRLVVAEPGMLSLECLGEFISEKGVTVIWMTSGLFNLLVTECLDDLRGLRQIIAGGEALSPPHVQRVLDELPHTQMTNGYGPTEVSIGACSFHFTAGDQIGETVPIGPPIANTTAYILDRWLNPVPIGIPGELYLGGPGVARGYHNLPELTAQKFIEHLFRPDDGRMFRTGDRCRWLSDGSIEFLGRMDTQVKIRGYRIEVEEIEIILTSHPKVRSAIVTAVEGISQTKELVAYVVSAIPESISASELRRYLVSRLPDYMVPSSFVFLDTFPLTSHGKIDRRALPEPDDIRSERTGIIERPTNRTQEVVVEIWQKILAISPIGIDDNFFDLGGHSLLALQMISRFDESLQIRIPVSLIFQYPTVREIAEQLADLEEVSENGKRNRICCDRIHPMKGRSEEQGPVPLSFTQQRLWFIDCMESGQSATYNVPVAFRLRGTLDVPILEQSLSEIIRRHQVLRTRFELIEDDVVQVIAESSKFPFTCEDLRVVCEIANRNDDEDELISNGRLNPRQRLERLLTEEASRPFDLTNGPVIRGTLFRVADEKHVLLLVVHHIAIDGWSIGLLKRELSQLYNAFLHGDPSPLPDLPLQYIDYSQWHREWLEGERYNHELNYWKQKLNGELPVVSFPTDKPRPAVQTFRGATYRFLLDEKMTDGIKKLGSSCGTTLFTTLLAVFKTLLYRYTEQEDILVGTAVANRTWQEIESLIGFFVNTLVLRTDFSGNPPFSEILGRVRNTVLEGQEHQAMPFERLVAELHPERSASYSSLFQVMFVLQNTGEERLQLEGLESASEAIDLNIAKFDITLSMRETPDGMAGYLQYNTDLFAQETIERMARHFTVLLEGILANPDTNIRKLPLLTEKERHQFLVEWNDTASDYPVESCIHALFEEQVHQAPTAIALSFDNVDLSYRELNERAEHLASELLRSGAKTGIRIGLCAYRSIEAIVGMLGILKVGCAYVPLDPAYPIERLSYILEDANLDLVVVQSAARFILPPGTCTQLVVDSIGTTKTARTIDHQDTPGTEQAPTDQDACRLAYIMYTSGSTGPPKGVCIEHRSVIRLVKNTNFCELDRDEVILQYASLSFDASTFEIWAALLNGGRLVIAPAGPLSLTGLGNCIRENEVTTLWLTAGLFHRMVDKNLDDLRGVRQLLAGGDVLSKQLIKKALIGLPDTRLINGYGPTEGTTFTTYHRITTQDLGRTSIPIGQPVSNSTVYVLDSDLNPVPVGVSGELHVGGAGIARGYLNHPDLTGTRFILNPFGSNPEDRLYKTGDICRRYADGTIEFMGRQDDQVKVRGFRIEPAEIESVLNDNPGVQQSAVITQKNSLNENILIAYVKLVEPESVAGIDIRSFLKARVPEYMIPTAIVIVSELPLTPTGKIDRRALPEWETADYIREDSIQAPRTETERELVRIWEELFNSHAIGIHDNFFEIGGHSLLAMTFISRIESEFDQIVPLSTFFQTPTVAGMARELETGHSDGTSDTLVIMRDTGERPPLFLIPGAGGHGIVFQQLVQSMDPEQPVYGLDAPGYARDTTPVDSIPELARHHISKMKAMQPEGPFHFAGYSFGGLVAFEVAKQLEEYGDEIGLFAVFDSFPPTRMTSIRPVRRTEQYIRQSLDWSGHVLSRYIRSIRNNSTPRDTAERPPGTDVGVDTRESHMDPVSKKPSVKMQQVLSASRIAISNYSPAPIPVRMTLFEASTSRSGIRSAFRQWRLREWSNLLTEVRVVPVPGKHTTMLKEPHVTVIAKQLNRILSRSRRAAIQEAESVF